MTEESITIVSDEDEILGSASRSEAIKNLSWRRACGGVIIDLVLGRVLVHQRSFSKDERPGVWVATFGGKSLENEPPLATAVRELFEEFSLSVNENNIFFWKKFKDVERHQFEYVYFVFVDSNIVNINKDSEVISYSWIDISHWHDIDKKPHPFFEYGYEKSALDIITLIKENSRRIGYLFSGFSAASRGAS